MSVVPDGRYDAIIVDAHDDDADARHFELTITSGPHRGVTLSVKGPKDSRDAALLLALPATLHVESGSPTLTIDE